MRGRLQLRHRGPEIPCFRHGLPIGRPGHHGYRHSFLPHVDARASFHHCCDHGDPFRRTGRPAFSCQNFLLGPFCPNRGFLYASPASFVSELPSLPIPAVPVRLLPFSSPGVRVRLAHRCFVWYFTFFEVPAGGREWHGRAPDGGLARSAGEVRRVGGGYEATEGERHGNLP